MLKARFNLTGLPSWPRHGKPGLFWRFGLFGLFGLFGFLLVLGLASCAGATSSPASSSTGAPVSNRGNGSSNTAPSAGSSNNNQKQNAADVTQYLIKTLKVSMNVKDTRKVADDLQSWISATDPRSTSAGIDYEQADNNQYNITMNFSVEASLYPQIERYLRDYPAQHDGQLAAFNESVQDVTNDYIDTQSRLKNLRGEQSRLLDLLSHATALGDILSIEQKLTDVEGQIETIEAHLKVLSNQVTYYTVTITLQPLAVTTQPQTATWSVGQTLHDALAASLGLAQGLASLLIWLLAFSIYIIPGALLTWLVIRWRGRRSRTAL